MSGLAGVMPSSVPPPPPGPGVPPPPPGPGVQPPFVAPPTDGAGRRRWTAIGLSIGALVLLCLGGATAGGGFLVLATRAVSEQAQVSVRDYLGALRDENYGRAYALLCDRLQSTVSITEFAQTERARPRVTGFEVGQTDLGQDITVPATVERADGSTRSVRFLLIQNTRTGGLNVCGEAD